jgi:hypothetical protein
MNKHQQAILVHIFIVLPPYPDGDCLVTALFTEFRADTNLLIALVCFIWLPSGTISPPLGSHIRKPPTAVH